MSMSVEGLAELHLPRTLRIRAAGHTLVLAKRAGESTAHVLLKAIGYARYLPRYPGLRVEVSIGERYKPDLVLLDDRGEPRICRSTRRCIAPFARRKHSRRRG